MNIINSITKSFYKIVFQAKKHSPELLMGAGCVGFVGTIVLACHETTKIGAIKEQYKKDIEDISDGLNKNEEGSLPEGITYTEEDAKKDTLIVFTHTALEYAKLYAPAVILGALSFTSIIYSHKILVKRNAALATACTTVASMFAKYRERVKDKYGESVDKELRYGTKAVKIKKTVTDEKTGEVKETEEDLKEYDIDEYSDYARIFDEGNTNWKNNAEYNLMFLSSVQNWANLRLHQRGYVFFNEVLDALGMRGCPEGQVVGWRENNPKGDDRISFGIDDIIENYRINSPFDDMSSRSHRADSYILDFNVDGPIYTDCDYTAKGANV